jgi:uncharacterized protein (TIGR03067 family)
VVNPAEKNRPYSLLPWKIAHKLKASVSAATSRPTQLPRPFALSCPSPFSCRHSPNTLARHIRPTMEDPMSMLLRSALVVVAGLTVQTSLFSADPTEKPKVEGQHAIVAMERNGSAQDEADFKGATFRFTDGKLVAANKDGTDFLNADYTIDADKTPCAIVLKLTAGSNKGKELPGLIERKDNTIRIIFAHPGGERPTEFKTKENQVMYTLRAEK